MTDVISLTNRTDDNRLWSVEQMLEDTLEKVRSGELKVARGFIVLMEERGSEYHLTRCKLTGIDMVWLTTVMQGRWVAKVRGTEK